MKLLEKNSFDYCRLKSKYPQNNIFYIEYLEGTYYDRSTTSYYNEKKELLETKDNGYYG